MSRQFDSPNPVMSDPLFEFHHLYDESPHSIHFHQHTFYELFFFLSGDVNYIIEDRHYKLRQGDILLISKSDMHHADINACKPYERIVVWLTEDFFKQMLLFFKEDFTACFQDAAAKNYRLIRPESQNIMHLKQLCTQISKAKHGTGIGNSAFLCAYLTEFLIYVSRSYYDALDSIKDDITENNKVNQIIAYINDNLTENLSLDYLANEFYLSKYYLSRKFKEFTGLSLYQYIMKKRLLLARNMLRTGTSVMNTCFLCGFNDYSNFFKAFKREFGKNPSSYSKESAP